MCGCKSGNNNNDKTFQLPCFQDGNARAPSHVFCPVVSQFGCYGEIFLERILCWSNQGERGIAASLRAKKGERERKNDSCLVENKKKGILKEVEIDHV